ncbi:MAG: branched chain amino acid aminotransferase, partial [Faecousia sp.]
GLCGTAAVISPVGKIVDHHREFTYTGDGPWIQKLCTTLRAIQQGRIPAPEGWIREIR